jgi:hypothetical protein
MMEVLDASWMLLRINRMDSIFSAVDVVDRDPVVRPSMWTEHMNNMAVKKVLSLVPCGQMSCTIVFWLKTTNTNIQ